MHNCTEARNVQFDATCRQLSMIHKSVDK